MEYTPLDCDAAVSQFGFVDRIVIILGEMIAVYMNVACVLKTSCPVCIVREVRVDICAVR